MAGALAGRSKADKVGETEMLADLGQHFKWKLEDGGGGCHPEILK
jgi:hypothetical protein